MKYLSLVLFSLVVIALYAQPKTTPKAPWKAHWICVPGEDPTGFGVYQFRKTITLEAIPSSFVVHASADNRYKLFVNEQLVSIGPARGDMFHWNYETINLASFLKKGINVISAVVWNYGPLRPEAQITSQTAFILEGHSETEQIINTDQSWKCRRDIKYSPLMPELLYTYYVSGPGESVDMNKDVAGWMSPDFVDTAWHNALQLFRGLPKGVFDWSVGWMLVPRTIPAMELTPQPISSVRKSEGLTLGKEFSTITIPPGTKASFLLDQRHLTNAYPVITFSGGKNAEVTLGYAEALYIKEATEDWRTHNKKGHRDSIEGKRLVGVKDKVISNGSANQEFSTLWWRTYRYLQVEIETRDEPLIIHSIRGIFTGYPFQMNARFSSNAVWLQDLLQTGWRTARLCAVETYMDCPYYEQLQYVGDTRIQALVSLFNSGDDRLMRNAIDQIDWSRMAEGITLSRFPTAHPQQIPPFSLWWIAMIHDYWMYRNDEAFVRSKLPGIRQVLQFFKGYQQNNGLLKNVPYWNFTDWAQGAGWDRGVAPVSAEGLSAPLDLQLLLAYQVAAQMESALGMSEYAQKYAAEASGMKKSIVKTYWDGNRQLFSDVPDKQLFSQHTNSLAILAEVIQGTAARTLAGKMLEDTALTQATIYFKYYVHQAAARAGLGDRYLELLGDWKLQLAQGLTTWAEISNVNAARSDCHAWGSSPNIELFRIVLGFNSAAPGFKSVVVRPHLGSLTEVSGSIPHPKGILKASYRRVNGGLTAEIELPEGLTGRLMWKGKIFTLSPGKLTRLSL